MSPLGACAFAQLMAPLGPYEAAPRLAVAVSGGADSTALAVLADGWARSRGGDVLALIVDHGLRAESSAEAMAAQERLAARGISARVIALRDLRRGPALAARARAARYEALEAACAEAGRVHLLLGHHAGDQAETLDMRLLARSGPGGLACMAALAERAQVRLLRPLLTVPPGRLRATLAARGMAWIEDPSNADQSSLRVRLRIARDDPGGDGPATTEAVQTASARGQARAEAERAVAAVLARRVTVAPEGYALLTPGALPAAALAALLRALSGAAWPPSPDAVAAVAARPRAATLGGVRLLPAGRLQPGGWLAVREAAAMAPAVPALDGALWDGRFRVSVAGVAAGGAEIGALGEESARLRDHSDLPAAVLRTIPAIRAGGALVAVPHLGYRDALRGAEYRAVFCPSNAMASAPFMSSSVEAHPVAEPGVPCR